MDGGEEPSKDDLSVGEHAKSYNQAPVGEFMQTPIEGRQNSFVHLAADAQDDAVVTWEASEYIHHQKDQRWFVLMAGMVIVLSGVLLFLVDWFSALAIGVMGVAFLIVANRQPETRRYSLSSEGLSIGTRFYDYDELKSFSVSHEGAITCITFIPAKRFVPAISIYASPDDEQKIVEVLSSVIPEDDHKPDVIDQLTRKIRF